MTMHDTFIATIILFHICATGAIRNLKEGPMIGPDSRQYKALSLPKEDPPDDLDAHSSRAAPVQVFCTEREMIVLISADLHSNGRRVAAEELSLGGSTEGCRASQHTDTQYVIKAELHKCGSELSIDEDRLVYSNHLVYTPIQKSFGILRTSCASIPVQCYYKRTHFVSSTDVKSPWAPTTKPVVEAIQFSFQLMNDDWMTKRSSYVYHLGDVMNIQAFFVKAEQAPFRLVMDSCLVTLEPNAASEPRYTLVHNHGCLVDSRVADSSACFLPRKQNNVLQMQMDAFRFNEDHRNTIYITCQLKIVDLEVNIMNKACTFSGHSVPGSKYFVDPGTTFKSKHLVLTTSLYRKSNPRWLSVDGKHEVCECCENTCDVNKQKQSGKLSRLPKRSVSGDTEPYTAMIGPIKILD